MPGLRQVPATLESCLRLLLGVLLAGMAFASAGVFAGTARAQATTPRAYAPLVVKNVGVNNTGIQVQNISGTPATVQVVYYDQLGRNLPFWNETQTVGVNASVTFYQGANPNLPQGFDGSAVINASQNVRAIINHADYSRGKASSGSFAAPVSGTAQVFLPAVFGGFNSYFTTINVQNAGTTRATYTVSLYPEGGATPIATIPRVLEPFAADRLRLAGTIGMPNLTGSAVITSSDGTLVATAETVSESNHIMLSYAGFPPGANAPNTPLLFKNYTTQGTWTSTAHVMNTSAASVTVRPTWFQRDSAVEYRPGPDSRAQRDRHVHARGLP